MIDHERFISRCITLGLNGLGTARPNPMVGCVIVHEGKIIGEGFTSPYGGSHAEVNAIESVKDKSLLKKSTLYVTLEPCAHHGKTPPCADLIVRYGIPLVVIGCKDPNPEVSGKGIEKIKASGGEVICDVLESECREHHKRFLTFQEKRRPYIILKWAESEDGFIAPKNKSEQRPVWISNTYSRQLVHKWRAEEQAILVGTETVIADNPKLDVRHWEGQNPTRIVLDLNNRLNDNYAIFDEGAKTIRVTSDMIDSSKPLAQEISRNAVEAKISSLIVEGGRKTLQTFIDEGLWDEARIFTGAMKINDGIQAPNINGRIKNESMVEGDQLKIMLNG